jgi:hypothetical protein
MAAGPGACPLPPPDAGSRVAFVDVRCRPEGEDRTRVSVGYEILALTDHGRAYLEDLSERAFAEMIDQWADLIKKSA